MVNNNKNMQHINPISVIVFLLGVLFFFISLYVFFINSDRTNENKAPLNSNQEKTLVPLNNENFKKVIFEYIDGKEIPDNFLNNKGFLIVSLIDRHLDTYGLSGDMGKFYNTDSSDRLSILQKEYLKMDKISLGYISISDYLNETSTCAILDGNEKYFCRDQTIVVEHAIENKMVDIKSLSILYPYLHAWYAQENNVLKKDYVNSIKILSDKYIDSIDPKDYMYEAK